VKVLTLILRPLTPFREHFVKKFHFSEA